MGIASTSVFFDAAAALRERVEQFLETAHELPALGHYARIDEIERTVAFLAEILLPYADAEERVFYPEASRLLGEVDASDAVHRARAELRRLIAGLTAVDTDDVGRLQELLYALYALLSAHFWRGEALYLRLLSEQPDERVRALLDRVSASRRPRRFPRGALVG